MNQPPTVLPEHVQLPTQLAPFYLTQNESLGAAEPYDDLLHRAANAEVTDDSATETQFFSLCVPEERIHAMGYLWYHPKLGMLTGGVWGWQGFKRHNLASEMFDIRAFMHDRVLAGDLHQYRLDNGYSVQILEPIKRHRMTYADQARGNALDVEFNAIAPPVMYGDGRHFEQAMRVRGELTLRGKRYDVSCTTVRDRSWGKPRPEIAMSLPPMGWKTGVFGDDFAFVCTAFDEPSLMPEFEDHFPIPGNQPMKGGWVLRDGTVRRLVSCRKRTARDPHTLLPTAVEWEGIDDCQHTYHMKGTAIAANDWSVQPNMRFVIANIRWECEGRIAYGELQEAHWTNFVHRFMR